MSGFSIGVDIVEVPRVGRLVRRKPFLQRVFSRREIAYCQGKKNAAQHFAVRFAAKEAVYKALGRAGIAHKNISVRNAPSGKPAVELFGPYKKLERRISISLSHTSEYAVAMAIFRR